MIFCSLEQRIIWNVHSELSCLSEWNQELFTPHQTDKCRAYTQDTFCISMHVHLIKRENQLQFKFNFRFCKNSLRHHCVASFEFDYFLGLCTTLNADEVNANASITNTAPCWLKSTDNGISPGICVLRFALFCALSFIKLLTLLPLFRSMQFN